MKSPPSLYIPRRLTPPLCAPVLSTPAMFSPAISAIPFSRAYISVCRMHCAFRLLFYFSLSSAGDYWWHRRADNLPGYTGNLIRRNPSDYNPRLIVVVRSVFNESWRSLLSASAWFLYFLFNALSPASVRGHFPVDVKRNQTHETEPRDRNFGLETEVKTVASRQRPLGLTPYKMRDQL